MGSHNPSPTVSLALLLSLEENELVFGSISSKVGTYLRFSGVSSLPIILRKLYADLLMTPLCYSLPPQPRPLYDVHFTHVLDDQGEDLLPQDLQHVRLSSLPSTLPGERVPKRLFGLLGLGFLLGLCLGFLEADV